MRLHIDALRVVRTPPDPKGEFIFKFVGGENGRPLLARRAAETILSEMWYGGGGEKG